VNGNSVLEQILNPGADDEIIAQAERSFEFEMASADEPAVAGLNELLHRHVVTSRHLIVTRRQHIVQVTTGMHVLVHVDVVGAYLQFGFEP
jgi:hypothetical protein